MKSYINHAESGFNKRLLCTAIVSVLAMGYMANSHAGATFKIDDTKWVSVGLGLRSSFTATESAAANKDWSNNFALDNARLYFAGQLHKYLKVEFNTDAQTANNGGEVRILDAIGKFEYNNYANVWVGRMLVPGERREMNGPFYSGIYQTFGSGTPFEPADYSLTIQSNGTSAGSYGRDDGATIWGAAFSDRLQYAFGFFRGLRGGANSGDNPTYAQKISYNFWEVEKNPGYYTSGTYYGKGGDILTVSFNNQYQSQGSGMGAITSGGVFYPAIAGDFRGTGVDVLMEKILPNKAVLTLEGDYKNYGISGNYHAIENQPSGDPRPNFNMFAGQAYDVSGMYMFPGKFGYGFVQPYVRYVNINPTGSSNRNSYQTGINYVIDGHNAVISLNYIYGDIVTKGLNYTSAAAGNKESSLLLGFQWQI